MIRVANLVNPTFGLVFSGHTHFLFSLLSGWNDGEISLNIYGTQVKPLNMNSGERDYRLPPQLLWSKQNRQDNRFDRLYWAFKTLVLLIRLRNEYDIAHFHTINWGMLHSPLVLHPLGKKVVFTMSLFGNDNPSHIAQQARGEWMIRLLHRFDGLIGLSPALVEDAQFHGMRNTILLPNFLAIQELEETPSVETRRQARAELQIPQDTFMILFVGSMIQRKGIDTLVDAFIGFTPRNPCACLYMVGPQSRSETVKIDETYVGEQKSKIRKAGLEDKVNWTGMINDTKHLSCYYQAADVFVLPSHAEGSPNVVAEAMFAGLPVIATRLPGITDQLVTPNENGYLIDEGNVDDFRYALVSTQDEGTRRRMGINSRNVAVDKFGFKLYCQKLKKFLRAVI